MDSVFLKSNAADQNVSKKKNSDPLTDFSIHTSHPWKILTLYHTPSKFEPRLFYDWHYSRKSDNKLYNMLPVSICTFQVHSAQH